MAEKTFFTSDFSGKRIEGERILVEFRRIGADGRLDHDFGVFVMDAHPEDKEVLHAMQNGRALSTKGRKNKPVEAV